MPDPSIAATGPLSLLSAAIDATAEVAGMIAAHPQADQTGLVVASASVRELRQALADLQLTAEAVRDILRAGIELGEARGYASGHADGYAEGLAAAREDPWFPLRLVRDAG